MSADNRFRSEILSLLPAPAGWNVRVTHIETDTKTTTTTYRDTRVTPVAAWALVKRWYLNREEFETAVEPVFYDGLGDMVNATAYRRHHSDIEPLPGDPQVTIAIETDCPARP